MIATASKLPASRPTVVRWPGGWSHLLDELRADAKAVVRAAFPDENLKRVRTLGPWCAYHSISRARNGDDTSALARLYVWFVVLKALGKTREHAQQMVHAAQRQVDRLWPAAEAPVPRVLLPRETELDTEEDRAQMAYLLGEPGGRARYIESLKQELAHKVELIQSLEQEERGGGEHA